MSGQSYVATSEAAQTAANDLLQITAPADAIVRIDKVEITQNTQTSSETLGIKMVANPATAGTGGAVTPTPIQQGFAAAGSTVLSNTTTNATGGTTVLHWGWNVLAPLIWHPTPDERYIISASDRLVFALEDAPGASMDITINVSMTEIGG